MVRVDGLVLDSTIQAPGFSGPGRAYIRPHDIELTSAYGGGAIRLITMAGPTVKLDVELASGTIVEVDLPLHRYNPATIAVGKEVGLVVRRLKVFPAAEAEEAAKTVSAQGDAPISL
jgi:sulfate transport system ATP-binding protein